METKTEAVMLAIKTKIECLLKALDNEIRHETLLEKERQNYHS